MKNAFPIQRADPPPRGNKSFDMPPGASVAHPTAAPRGPASPSLSTAPCITRRGGTAGIRGSSWAEFSPVRQRSSLGGRTDLTSSRSARISAFTTRPGRKSGSHHRKAGKASAAGSNSRSALTQGGCCDRKARALTRRWNFTLHRRSSSAPS